MQATPNQTFKITVPITRCYTRKAADGTDRYVVEGMASNTNLDLTGERMAESAIVAMEKSIEVHPIVFKSEHGDEWDAEFGQVTALKATDDHRLQMVSELDPDHYRTKTLVKALEKGKQLGLSIGGMVPEGGWTWEWVDELKRSVRTYTDILLYEISVTGSPAVADTWLTNINKSIKGNEEPMPENKEVEKTVDTVEAVETTDEKPEVAEVAAADATATAEESTDETAGVTEGVEDTETVEEPTETGDVEKPAADEVEVSAATDKPALKEEVAETAEEQAEKPAETTAIESETTQAPAEAETTEKSTDNADVAPETQNPPVETEAAAQEEEAPASADAAPEQANDDTSEVSKSAIFGDYAAANVAEVSVRALTEELTWKVWSAVALFDEDERTPEERKAFIAQALTEYSQIIQAVTDALIDNGTTADAEKSFVIPRADEVAKSVSAKDTEIAELTKAIAEKDDEHDQLAATLEDTEARLEKFTARKAHIYAPFGSEAVDGEEATNPAKSVSPTLYKWLYAK